MNPKIAIVVDAKNKAISTLTGMVTVGSKVDIDVSGIASSDVPNWTATDKFTGPSLRFRIVDEFGHDLVRYQLHEKTETTPDVWTWDSTNSKFTASNVDFNTNVLRKAFCGVPFDECREFGIILDSVVDAAQYAVGKIKIRQWASSSMEDPTILPDWREVLAELESDLDDVQSAKDTAVSAATSATSSANSATSSASSATSSANLAQTLANNAATSASSASSSASRAEVASSHYPKISTENNHWLVWDATATVPGYVDTGVVAKGEKGEVEKVLEGETMESNPTQRQLATALKTVWTKLGGTIVCLMACLFANADVTRETEWQDVPPETKIGTVVDLGQGGGSSGTDTNAVQSIIQRNIDTNLLCTVEAAQGMTNGVMQSVDGKLPMASGFGGRVYWIGDADYLIIENEDGTQYGTRLSVGEISNCDKIDGITVPDYGSGTFATTDDLSGKLDTSDGSKSIGWTYRGLEMSGEGKFFAQDIFATVSLNAGGGINIEQGGVSVNSGNRVLFPSPSQETTFATMLDIPSTNGLITAQTATNIVKDATNALATVAHTGSYNDLSNTPTIPAPVSDSHITNIANSVVEPTSNVVFNTETYFAINDGDLELVSDSNLVFQAAYELTNYTDTASISLYHGQLASQRLTSQNALNITLKYPTGAQKAGDAMLRVVSTLAATATVVSVEGATSFHFAGTKDWNVFDAGSTNLLSFTKVAMENGEWEIWVGKAKSEL